MSPAVDPLIGSVIAGRFEVVRVIGKGGMGTIYEVRNTRLGRSFALKTLSSNADAETLARFRREAEIVAKLTHPNILDVVDWDVLEDGSPCMIMEYLRGEDLGQRIKESGAFPWADFARIADQVLSALSVAHRAGIVHRDLKPQNIFLASDDSGEERVKLLDFGISKLRDSITFTTTDQKVMGTPAYMPPEQAEGKQDEVGTPSDIWSMAAILYEMASAKVAFEGPSIPSILYRVCHGRPESLLAHRPDAPPALVALLDRALTVDMTARPTVDQMRAELRVALSTVPGVSWPEPLRARNSNAMLGRQPGPTPVSGVPRSSNRLVDTGPAAMAATLVGGAATLPGNEREGPPKTSTADARSVTAGGTAAPALGTMTTLGTGETSTRTPARRARWPFVLLALGVAGAAAAIVVFARPSAPSPVASASPAGPAAVPALPTPTEKAPEHVEPPVAPSKVVWDVESTPAGADVYRMPSEIKVGVTPWNGQLDRTDGVAVFLIKKAGFADEQIELDLREGGTRRVELTKLAAGTRPSKGTSARGSGAGSGAPATGSSAAPQRGDSGGRHKGEPVDPFKTRKKGEPVDPFGTH